MSLKTLSKIVLSILIIIALGLTVSKEVDFKKVLGLISAIPKTVLVILFLISFLMALMKALRFYLLLVENDIPISLWQATKVYLAGQSTSPLPGGEAMRGALTKVETKTPLIETSGPVITQAFLELISAAVLAIVGSIVFDMLRLPAALALIIVIGLTFIMVNNKAFKWLSKKISKITFLKKLSQKLIKIQKSIQESIVTKSKELPNRNFLLAFLTALLTHILGGLIIYLTAKNLGVNLSVIQSIFIYTCGIVITAIAGIVPGGLGFTEGGLTTLLLYSNVSLNGAVAIVLIFRLTTLVFYILIGSLSMLIFYNRWVFKSHK